MSDSNIAEMQFCRKRTSQQDRAASKKLKIIVVSRIYSDALLTSDEVTITGRSFL